jgi:hypothetical protein
MRVALHLVVAAGLLVVACGLENRDGADRAGADGGPTATGDGGAEAGVQGAYCGAERQTGIQLCAATSMCPDIVIDTQAMPSCGFRIRGSAVDLVCGCGEQVCPMGIFSNCTQAAQLLANQSEGQVCAQISEGRCTSATNASTSSTSSGGSTSSSSSSGNTACDKQCYADCGGGAACASVCNCN